jgi:hypothetical protein
MVRHYSRLKEIKSRPVSSAGPNKPAAFHLNPRFETHLQTGKKATRAEMLSITLQNQKLEKALDKISSTYGNFSPFVIQQTAETKKKKSLGFKQKSHLTLIKENMRYLSMLKAVKPVYNHKDFEDERKKYQHQKNNLAISSQNFRIYEKRNLDAFGKMMKVVTSETGATALQNDKINFDPQNRLWYHKWETPANTIGTMSSAHFQVAQAGAFPDASEAVRPKLIRPLSAASFKPSSRLQIARSTGNLQNPQRPRSASNFVFSFHHFAPSTVLVGDAAETKKTKP